MVVFVRVEEEGEEVDTLYGVKNGEEGRSLCFLSPVSRTLL